MPTSQPATGGLDARWIFGYVAFGVVLALGAQTGIRVISVTLGYMVVIFASYKLLPPAIANLQQMIGA